MFNFLKKKDSPESLLKKEVIATVSSEVPVKKKAYHELVAAPSGGYTLRVYSRKENTVLAEVFVDNKHDAVVQALAILKQFNGE